MELSDGVGTYFDKSQASFVEGCYLDSMSTGNGY